MGVPGELHRAIHGLRRAAEAGFTGNSYYQAVNRITDLTEAAGPAEESAAPGEDRAYDFATMLAAVRKGVQSQLSGNRYYMAVNKLEELASFARQASQAPAKRGPSFEDLAAASNARVEAAAASLGIATARRAVPLDGHSARISADGELERRSSEPCLMAELAPPDLEPVAPAPIFAEAGTPAPHGKAAQSLGSPVKAAGDPAAGQEMQGKEPGEIKRKQPKTLFKLWLDLAFGRKD